MMNRGAFTIDPDEFRNGEAGKIERGSSQVPSALLLQCTVLIGLKGSVLPALCSPPQPARYHTLSS